MTTQQNGVHITGNAGQDDSRRAELAMIGALSVRAMYLCLDLSSERSATSGDSMLLQLTVNKQTV